MRHIPSYLDDASHECFVVLARFNDSFSRTDAMRPMLKVNTIELKPRKSVLLGTSALVCLALAAPVMADVFKITSSDGTTNGNIGEFVINGSDTVSLGIDLTTTSNDPGIGTRGGTNTITVSETGRITTGSIEAIGIYNFGASNETTVSGSIETGGDYSYGIQNEGALNETTVSGSITTGGTVAHGIYNWGASNTATVSGSITTTGTGAHGIYNYGGTNTTTISGTVKATGASSAALHTGGGDGNSFTLNEGAIIIGDILADDAATNSKLAFNLGASTSYAYSVSGKGEGKVGGQWDFSDQDGRSEVVTTSGTGCDNISGVSYDTCNLVTGAGIGNAEVQNELQYITNSALIGSLQFGSAVATSEDAAPSQDMWAKAYGVSSELKTTTAIAFDASTAGLTIGKPIVMGDDLDLDLVFNISSTDLDVGKTGDQSITAQGINFGVVLKDLAPSSGWDINAFGFVGKNSYDGTRKVMNNQQETGSETVTSSFSGTEVLVGVDAGYTKAMSKGLSFTSNVNATLSNESIGAYSESKYFAWGARKVTQVAGGVSVGLMHERDALTTFVTLGADFSSLLSGKTATYTNQGTAAPHTDSETDDTYGTLTVGFNYKSKNGASFVGAINASSSNNGLTSTAANLGLNWTF